MSFYSLERQFCYKLCEWVEAVGRGEYDWRRSVLRTDKKHLECWVFECAGFEGGVEDSVKYEGGFTSCMPISDQSRMDRSD